MAHTHAIDKKNNLVITALTARVSGQDLVEVYTKVCTDLTIRPTYHHLWDCRYITELDVEWEAMEKLKQLAHTYCPKEKEGIGRLTVVASRELVYSSATAIIFFIGKQNREKQVFRTLEEALEWLDIEMIPAYLNA